MSAAAVGCCLPCPSLSSPSDERTVARAGNGSDEDSEPWLLSKAALPRCSAMLLAVLLVATSITCTAAANVWPATGSVGCREQARAVPRSRLARGKEGGQQTTCFRDYNYKRRSSTSLLQQQPAFGCAAAAPPLLVGRRHWANGVGRRRPCSAALKTARNGEYTVPR